MVSNKDNVGNTQEEQNLTEVLKKEAKMWQDLSTHGGGSFKLMPAGEKIIQNASRARQKLENLPTDKAEQ